MKKHAELLRKIVSWLAALTACLLIALVYVFFLKQAPELEGGQILLPAATCPDQSFDPVQPFRFRATGITILYRDKGCNAVSDTQIPVTVSDEVIHSEQELRALGLPPLRKPIAIELFAHHPESGSIVVAKPGSPGAFVINSSDLLSIAFWTDRSVAELMLAEAAPGLSESDRLDLAAGYALLLADPTLLGNDELRSSALAIETARVLARGGYQKLTGALSGCLEHACSLRSALDQIEG